MKGLCRWKASQIIRGAGFHETVLTMVSALFASSDPYQTVKTRTYGQEQAAPGKLGEA